MQAANPAETRFPDIIELEYRIEPRFRTAPAEPPADGRALRATGVQHPAPTLFCTCNRNGNELVVEAPYAQAVLGGKN
ncbi:MAG: hypothetical protein GEU82_12475, partial [Luteitalea sp.]|nr:hypothetical protein [Luteitalea sp.]